MTDKQPPTRVWILGAGFSRALGGPLFDDLLQETNVNQISKLLPNEDSATILDVEQTFRLWRYSPRFSDATGSPSSHNGAVLWQNAEQFLVELSYVADGLCPPLTLLDGVLDQAKAKNLYRCAASMIAAQCHHFVARFEKAKKNYECWSPYMKWLTKLDGHDYVFTFNYDLVFEEAAKAVNRDFLRADEWRPTGSEVSPMFVKLHGSVGQSADAHKIYIPGSSKMNATKNELGKEWALLRKMLAQAGAVRILGYSLPPSDALSRRDIVESLRNNRNCKIDLVLGRVRGPEVNALETVLTMLGTQQVNVRTVNAEEYIDTYPHADKG